jgi:hypothetical protein
VTLGDLTNERVDLRLSTATKRFSDGQFIEGGKSADLSERVDGPEELAEFARYVTNYALQGRSQADVAAFGPDPAEVRDSERAWLDDPEEVSARMALASSALSALLEH